MLILLQPLRQSHSIDSVALTAQTQGLQTQDELLRRERVQGRAQIAENFNTNTNGVCNRAKSLPKLQPVVAL